MKAVLGGGAGGLGGCAAGLDGGGGDCARLSGGFDSCGGVDGGDDGVAGGDCRGGDVTIYGENVRDTRNRGCSGNFSACIRFNGNGVRGVDDLLRQDLCV